MPDPSLSPLPHDLGQSALTRALRLLDAALGLVTSLADITSTPPDTSTLPVEADADRGVRLSDALTSRDVIAMAQGVHMSRLSISAEAAAAELHRAARTKAITVRDEAVAVLDSTRPGGVGPGGRRGR